LACDAANDRAVGLLRERKRRSGKAFAIMARDIDTVERYCFVTAADRALLTSCRSPIVLLQGRGGATISQHVAPGNTRLGVMLPYTPLHTCCSTGRRINDALVMTSGNLSEEPSLATMKTRRTWEISPTTSCCTIARSRRGSTIPSSKA